MKNASLSLLLSLALAGTSFAGQEMVSSGKDYKTQPAPTCFNDHELQVDVFGAYVDGNASSHAGPVHDHGWGGGIGINYFFTRMFGVSVDATWIYAKENAASDPSRSDNGSTIFHNFSGSLVARFPSDSTCLAPYAFVGGGFHVDGDQWASVHGGAGIEYRVVPNRVGLFTDARWTYFGDRYGQGDQNNFMGRAGVRFVF